MPRSAGTKALSNLAFWHRFHASTGHRDLAWCFGIANSGQRGAVSDRRDWCLVLQSRRSKSLGEREIFIIYVYIVWSYIYIYMYIFIDMWHTHHEVVDLDSMQNHRWISFPKKLFLLLTLDPTRWQSPVQVALWCYASAFQLCRGFQCALFEFPRAPREVHCWGVNDQGTSPKFTLAVNLVGCFLKWWYPQNTPKWSFLVGKAMVVGYHHCRKPPVDGWIDFRVLKVNLVRATPLLGHWSRLGRKRVAWEKSQKCARFFWITET